MNIPASTAAGSLLRDIDLNQRPRNAADVVAEYEKLLPISIYLRSTISAFQWISAVLYAVVAIMGIVDIAIAPTDPKAWVYDDEDDAIMAGFPFASGSIPWYAYISVEAGALIFSLVAALLEWRVYRFSGVGLDLSWPPLSNKNVRMAYKSAALARALKTKSLYGVAYNNYYFSVPLLHLSLTGLFVFHMAAGRQVLKFASVFVVTWIIFAFLLASNYIHGHNKAARFFMSPKYVTYREVETRDVAEVGGDVD